MNIHNSMEDAVTKTVNELYEQLKTNRITWLNCDCENCRLDTICYVLNRTQPKYSVSERGILHNALDMNDSQLKADITSIALDGIRLINTSKRSYHSAAKAAAPETMEAGKKVYNFPVIIGSVFDGETFEPLENVSIKLSIDGEPAVMSDSTWSNPAKTYKSTRGSYSFWPKAVECAGDAHSKVFKLTFEISADNYNSTTYAVEMPLIPENVRKTTLDGTYSLKIKDIFLFDKNTDNPME